MVFVCETLKDLRISIAVRGGHEKPVLCDEKLFDSITDVALKDFT